MRKIEYKSSVDRDLRRLDRHVATRIIDKIEQELPSADLRPVPLSGPFDGLYNAYPVAVGRIVMRAGFLVVPGESHCRVEGR